MRRRLYDGARALRPVRDQSATTIGNSQHRTRQSKLLCHWPCAVFTPESVVDNAANGALTLRSARSGALIPPPARLHWQACRWSPPRRRQRLVQGGEEQLSILRREYQRRADLQDLPFISGRADQHQPPAGLDDLQNRMGHGAGHRSLIVLLFSSRKDMKPKAQFSGELSGLPGHREILRRRASRRNASIF